MPFSEVKSFLLIAKDKCNKTIKIRTGSLDTNK